jgi:hypothetical protein
MILLPGYGPPLLLSSANEGDYIPENHFVSHLLKMDGS